LPPYAPLHLMMAMKLTWSYRDRADHLAARLTQITGAAPRNQPALRFGIG